MNNGFTISIGCKLLGTKGKSIHLLAPLISTPTNKVKKRIIIEATNK